MKKNTLTKEYINKIIHSSKFTYSTEFGKNTVVTMQLPNGFVLTASSACVDPANYDEKLGYEICINKLTEKVWELEGYLLQNELYRKSQPERNLMDCTIRELYDQGYSVILDQFSLNERSKVTIEGRG